MRASKHFVGVDGEGCDRAPHRYVYMAAGDEQGRTWEDEDPDGLSTQRCLDFLLSLPNGATLVGFSVGYDWTKALADLPDRDLYRLAHEDERREVVDLGGGKSREVVRPVKWRGYRINLENRRLTVARGERRRTVWDFFKFFQSSFVTACDKWKVTAGAELVAQMKRRRGTFTVAQLPEVAAYCKQECANLATLARELVDAHEEGGITLKRYDGPGSSAAVLLDRWKIRDLRGPELPAALRLAIACAYIGGRFELGVGGPLARPLYPRDLASAYPYAAALLPCLVHGRWSLVQRPSRKRLSRATMAVVHWTGGTDRGAWGALPVRDKKGHIVWPLAGKGGWCWEQEYFAAQALARDGYEAVEAWCYDTDCDCPPPLGQISDAYRWRLSHGKNGAGRALRLGINSVAGKLMQSRGRRPPFQSWVWGGQITSRTRAELLRGLVAAGDGGRGVVMLATDGLYATHPVDLPAPRDTGTADLQPPLGQWDGEGDVVRGGLFLLRPGVYLSLDPSEGAEGQRARGVGRHVLEAHRQQVLDAWDAGEGHVTLSDWLDAETGEPRRLERFVGMSQGVRKREIKGDDGVVRSTEYERAADYGEWVKWRVKLSFSPEPKRMPETRAIRGSRARELEPFRFVSTESLPYDPAVPSDEAVALAELDRMTADGEVRVA